MAFLEDRRLLYGRRTAPDDFMHCVESAIEIRKFLTERLAQAMPGKELDQALRIIREAFREFVEAAGPNSRDFRDEIPRFFEALYHLQEVVGLHAARIANNYGLAVEPQLESLFPS